MRSDEQLIGCHLEIRQGYIFRSDSSLALSQADRVSAIREIWYTAHTRNEIPGCHRFGFAGLFLITRLLFAISRKQKLFCHPFESSSPSTRRFFFRHTTKRSRVFALAGTQWLRSRKVCSARRADFGVFGHLIPAVANERSYRHASANDEKWNANDCTDYSPAK
jgi:hypothetical protein